MIKEILAALFAFSFVLASVAAAIPEAGLSVETAFDSVCPCSTLTQDDISVSVKNLDDKEATYTLSLSLPDDSWSGFIVPSVTLPGGGEAKVSVFVTPSCFVNPGKYTVAVFAYSSVSGKTSTADVKIEVGKCRWIEIKAKDYEACQGKETSFMVNIENQGTETEKVRLSTDIEWAFFPEGAIEIKSGESADVKLVLQPPEDLEGLGEITISAVSESSYARSEETVDTEVLKCYATEFSLSPKNIGMCPCKSAELGLSIKNTGLLSDDYTVTYGDVSQTVKIKDGETGSIPVSVNVACDGKAGNYTLGITIQSSDPKAPLTASAMVSVLPSDECYSVSLTTENASTAAIAVGQSETFMLSLGNAGKFTQDYGVAIDGPQWVHLSQDKVKLGPGSGAELYVYAAPDYSTAPGNYSVKVRASSASGEEDSISFTLAVVSDFGSDGSNISMSTSIPTGNVVGNAERSWPQIAMITMLAIGVAFILILRFVVLMK